LKRGWPGGEDPLLDPDHVLLLCRIHNFREGLIFLYESLRLFREVLQVHMADHDHAALIEACIRLGDASRGGDPHLWTEVLEYFGSQTSDCTAQVWTSERSFRLF
jgi:vacuolar protein sorting-associated protein 11